MVRVHPLGTKQCISKIIGSQCDSKSHGQGSNLWGCARKVIKLAICTKCGVEKPQSQFQSYVTGDKTYTRLQCTSCKMERQRQRKAEIGELVKIIKESKGCSSCGFSNAHALQFHHVDPNKEINIADAVRSGWSLRRIEDEIRKCIVLCSNCHLILHAEERDIRE